MLPDFVHASQYLTSLWFGLPPTDVAAASAGLADLDPAFRDARPLEIFTSQSALTALWQEGGRGNSLLRLLGSPFSADTVALLSRSDPRLLDPELRPALLAPALDLSRLTLGETLKDPRLSPYLETIDRVGERYRSEVRPRIRRSLGELVGYVQGCGDVMTPKDFQNIRQHLLLIEKSVGETASLIGGVLTGLMRDAKTRGIDLPAEFKVEIWRLIMFLDHDIAHFLPHELWRITEVREAPDERLMRLSTGTLKTVFSPEHIETLEQYVSFPAGIIPELYRISVGKHIEAEKIDLFGAMTVISGMVFQRMSMVHFRERILSRPGLQPELSFSVAREGEVEAGAEGIFLRGERGVYVHTYPCALLSILYNTVKNTLFAVHEKYEAEDPLPEGDITDTYPAWKERQKTRVSPTKIRLEAEVRPRWGKAGLDNVAWLRIGDRAGGFPLNRIWQLAHAKLTHHLTEILAEGPPAGPEELRRRLVGLRVGDLHDVVDNLQRRLGLRDRSLVERLLQAYLNPRRVNQFTLQDTMELASVFTLSGAVGTKKLHSGFGLYGIKILAPSSGIHYLHSTIPYDDTLGTETILAVQSLGGFMHAESTVRGMIESGVAA